MLTRGRKTICSAAMTHRHTERPLYILLVETCKFVGVVSRVWIEDVLRKIPYYERDKKDITELLPRD